ncbi:MAG: hypothetical protein P8188_06520 [Gemmatimonadota bacterium]
MGLRTPAALLLAVLVLGSCSLTEITTASAEDMVVVEALFQRRDDLGLAPSRILVFLHRTVQGAEGLNEPVDGARVRVAREDGTVIEVTPARVDECVASTPLEGTGSCYVSTPEEARAIQPGERLELTVRTPQGEVMEGTSVVPGGFSLATAADGGICHVEPDDPLEVMWSVSDGAWSYLNEIAIAGLPDALPDLVELEIPDPLVLLGLSVSATDTTIVVPSEFGIIDRFDLDQPLALALQEGLPAGSQATVGITAVDRNYVNWIRGGNFNPSGQVRVSSVRGDGTGFFGSGVMRSFRIRTDGAGEPCLRFHEGGPGG